MELTSLEPRRKGLTQLYLDGEPGPKLDTEVVLLARLQPGDILSEEELQELVERSDARRAQEKALYLDVYKRQAWITPLRPIRSWCSALPPCPRRASRTWRPPGPTRSSSRPLWATT